MTKEVEAELQEQIARQQIMYNKLRKLKRAKKET